MNLFVKLTGFFLILALAAPFVLKGPDGGPLISFKDVESTEGGFGKGIDKAQSLLTGPIQSIFSFNQANSQSSLNALGGVAVEPNLSANSHSFQVYKWKDKNGKWHFSDEQNLQGSSELVIIENDASIVEMDNKALLIKMEQIYNANPLDLKTKKSNALDFPDLAAGKLSLKDMLSTFEKAKEVQAVVDTRHEAQNQAMDSL